jgi:flagellar biosynthetic protein FliR
MSTEYLITWMMVFLRALGVILLLPMLTNRPLPVPLRMAFGVFLATLLAGIVPAGTVPTTWWHLILMSAGEVIMGLTLGFVVKLSFFAVEMGGRLISSEIGLSTTPGMGVPEPANEPIAAMLSSFAVVIFFMLGAHHVVLGAFARSFVLAGPGRPLFDAGVGEALIRGTGGVLELGLRMAAPFIAINFLVTLAFSVLGRAVPKMNVFIVSYSGRVFMGLTLLAAAGGLMARYLFMEFGNTAARMLQVLPLR